MTKYVLVLAGLEPTTAFKRFKLLRAIVKLFLNSLLYGKMYIVYFSTDFLFLNLIDILFQCSSLLFAFISDTFNLFKDW